MDLLPCFLVVLQMNGATQQRVTGAKAAGASEFLKATGKI